MRISFTGVFLLFITVLLGASIFFTANIISFKEDLGKSSKDINIESGKTVKIVKIIDGDEVSAKFNNEKFIIRILGIVSYDTTINDPQVGNIAKLALNYLEKTLLNQDVIILYDEFKKDPKNRLLAYIHKDETDIGEKMVEMGVSLVFTKYLFSRLNSYLLVETDAIVNKRGLWGIPDVAKRSLKFKKIWEKERTEDK